MTPQERAEQVAHTYYSLGPTNLIDLIAESLQETRRAALLEACVAVSQFSSDGRPIDAQELRIALVQLLGEMAK